MAPFFRAERSAGAPRLHAKAAQPCELRCGLQRRRLTWQSRGSAWRQGAACAAPAPHFRHPAIPDSSTAIHALPYCVPFLALAPCFLFVLIRDTLPADTLQGWAGGVARLVC